MSAVMGKNQRSRAILQKYLNEMAATDSLIFTKENYVPQRSQSELTGFQPLMAKDSLKISKEEAKSRLEEQKKKDQKKSGLKGSQGFDENEAEPSKFDEIDDGSRTVRANEDDTRPDLQDVFKKQLAVGSADLQSNPVSKPASDAGRSEKVNNKSLKNSEPVKQQVPEIDENPASSSKQFPPVEQKGEKESIPDKIADKLQLDDKDKELLKSELTEQQLEEMASKFNVPTGKLGKMMKGYEKAPKSKKSDKGGKTKMPSFESEQVGQKDAKEVKESKETKEVKETKETKDLKDPKKLSGLDELENLSVADEQDYKTSTDSRDTQLKLPPKQWKVKYTLRSHFDAVRVVAFRENENVLLSASEDATIKLWNTGALPTGKKQSDPDPFFTLRGHSHMVLSLALWEPKNGDPRCFSGSADGTIRIWKVPPSTRPIFEPYDSKYTSEILASKLDAVWGLKMHPVRGLLAAASASGLIRLWNVDNREVTQTMENIERDSNPTSVDYAHTDLKKLVASYSNSKAHVFDLETGKSVLSLQSDATCDNTTNTQINQIITHPTLSLAITAHEDKHIRFFDLNSGKCVNSMVAHLDAVSCISINPNGLNLISGGHDSSIRCWDITTYACTQEFTSHRKKYDEGVHSLAFHPNIPILASGGADSTVRVYT